MRKYVQPTCAARARRRPLVLFNSISSADPDADGRELFKG